MIAFYRAYTILPQPVAKLENLFDLPIVQRFVAQIPWVFNIVLVEKIRPIRAQIRFSNCQVDLTVAKIDRQLVAPKEI